MKKIFFILLFFFISSQAFSQYYPEVWDSTMVYENEYYKIEVPKKWRNGSDESSRKFLDENMLNLFEGSGIGFPLLVNDAPLMINITIMYAGKFDSEDSLVNLFLEDMLIGKDTEKVFPENYTPLIEDLSVKSGEMGKVIKHRYFRKSNEFNQTRYTLAIINPKTKDAFFYALSLQYVGQYSSFESYLKMDEFAWNVYKHFELK